jgi:RND superfamily putative drug exporter
MGILTWIFIEGHGAGLMNFTPGPIMAPVLVLIISIVFGLSTDYEVFLLSRMVEAREKGASTSEAIRIGTSHTGRIITAAALILIVVTGAFAFSDLVMMKYIAYGMIAALIIDATLIRMFLVPATMKLLGDDCWWAPQWMKRIQRKLGLGETILEDELLPTGDVPELALAGGAPSSTVAPPMRPTPRRGEPLTEPIPVVAPHGGGPIRATHAAKEESRRSVTGRPATPPEPTRAAPTTPPKQAEPQPDSAQPYSSQAYSPQARSSQAYSPQAPAARPTPPRPAEPRPPVSGPTRAQQVPPRPHVEPEPTQAADVVRPAPPSAAPTPAPAQSPQPPSAPPSRTRSTRAGRAEEPDSRSIESWLADLRAPSASQAPRPSTPRSESPLNGSHGSDSHGSNGHGSNGHSTGANGSSSIGSTTNGAATNGAATNGAATNGAATNGADEHGTNGSSTGAHGGTAAGRNGSGRNGNADNGSERRGSNGNGIDRNGSDSSGSVSSGSISSGSDHRTSERHDTESNGNGVGASSESDREEKPSGRRAAPSTEGGDSGRHRGGDNGQVLSVSELLARERNRSR